MTRRIYAGRIAFAAAIALSLGVGAQSAFARPAPSEERATTCYSGYCYRDCREGGWAGGRCVGGSTGWCECF